MTYLRKQRHLSRPRTRKVYDTLGYVCSHCSCQATGIAKEEVMRKSRVVIDRLGMLRAFRLDEIFRAQLGLLVEVNEWSACIDTLCREVHMDNQRKSLGYYNHDSDDLA
jgi:hypothetical protein